MVELDVLAFELTINGMSVAQIKKLQKWWFAQGRTISDLDAKWMIDNTVALMRPVGDFILTNGPIVMNELQHKIEINGQQVHFGKREYDLMRMMLANAGRAIAYKEFEEYFPLTSDAMKSVRVYVGGIRRKLSVFLTRDIIISKDRFGYMMENLNILEPKEYPLKKGIGVAELPVFAS